MGGQFIFEQSSKRQGLLIAAGRVNHQANTSGDPGFGDVGSYGSTHLRQADALADSTCDDTGNVLRISIPFQHHSRQARQNADDGDHDRELDQGKASLAGWQRPRRH